MKRGFTLIELMVVISIIMILAAMTLGISGYVQDKAARSRAQSEIAALETALENYKIDNGDYPKPTSYPNPLDPTSPADLTTYTAAAQTLYQALSGGQTVYSTPLTADKQGKVYFEFKKNQTTTINGLTAVADPWKNPYGFNHQDSTTDATSTKCHNLGFVDLWSTAGNVAKGNASDAVDLKWVTNWGQK